MSCVEDFLIMCRNDVFECFEIWTKWGTKRPPVSVDTTLRNCQRAFVTILMTRCRGQVTEHCIRPLKYIERRATDIQQLSRTFSPFASENNDHSSPSKAHRNFCHYSASLLNQDDGVRCNVKRGQPEITE